MFWRKGCCPCSTNNDGSAKIIPREPCGATTHTTSTIDNQLKGMGVLCDVDMLSTLSSLTNSIQTPTIALPPE